MIVLPGTGSRGAWLVAERVRAALRALGAGAWLLPTASIGVASYPEHGIETRELLRAADSAMYDAKRLGRNRSIVFEPTAARARSVRTAQAQEENEDHLSSVIALAEALDARDPFTHSHSRTVGGFAARIADRLGLAGAGRGGAGGRPAARHREDRRVRRGPPQARPAARLRVAAGAAPPRGGLRDPDPPEMEEIREWVLRHHERPDGTGYPGRLKGDAIPLEARILAVADAYEAMISNRPYRQGKDPADAQAELSRCRGTQFDGAVVDAFLGALRDDPPDPLL